MKRLEALLASFNGVINGDHNAIALWVREHECELRAVLWNATMESSALAGIARHADECEQSHGQTMRGDYTPTECTCQPALAAPPEEEMSRAELIAELHRQTKCALKSQAALQRELDSRVAAPPEGRKQICSWRQDADGIYHTACKHTFYFDDDSGAIESGFTHCAYCGNVLTETKHEDPRCEVK